MVITRCLLWCYISPNMSIQGAYRRIPDYLALPLAFLASAIIALAVAAIGALTTGFLLEKLDGADGPGAGVLVILLVFLNMAASAFIGGASVLANLHPRSSWRIPVLAFVFCVILVRALGPFDVQFAPFYVGTGLVVCLLSCWFLRRKEVASTEHAI